MRPQLRAAGERPAQLSPQKSGRSMPPPSRSRRVDRSYHPRYPKCIVSSCEDADGEFALRSREFARSPQRPAFRFGACPVVQMVQSTAVPKLLSEAFSDAMSRVCSPVAVVTTIDQSPHGTTVSAFASLSLNPPMVLVALDHQSELLARITRTSRFGLNVLSSEQAPLARRFAKKGPDSFDGLTWYDEAGCPRIEGAAVWLCCRVADLVEGGDHRVALAEVVRLHVTETKPLVYHARAFGTHAPVETAQA